MTLPAILLMVLVGVLAGPLLARIERVGARRASGWLLVVFLIVAAHLALCDQGAVARMVGLCLVLFGSMKGLVYAEWAGTKSLSWSHYGAFALLWFGMNPGDFVLRRGGLDWKRDVVVGGLFMLLGTLGAWWVWRMEWRQILVMFVPMSLGFHFGALRVLKGILRAAGFPVRTLFPNVLEARGIADFWSRRWNVGYSQMMQRVVGRPVGQGFGRSSGTMAVFLVSGLLHEVSITLPVRTGFGLPTLYFLVHGVLTLLEARTGRAFGKLPALLAVALPLGFLFPPAFQTEVIEVCLGVFEWF